jgi:nitrate/nitrite transporter NarK
MKGIVGLLLLVGFVVVYWQWVLAVVVLVLIVRAAPAAWREVETERADEERRQAEVVARADEQHRWAVAGDPRGTFGEYAPASMRSRRNY